MTTLRQRLRHAVSPIAERAARAFVAGARVEDAVRVARQHLGRGHEATIGYWNAGEETVESVHQAYRDCVAALARFVPGGYLSIKLPALGYDADRLRDVVARAAAAGRRVHFDSLGPETVERTFERIEALRSAHPDLGCTLPGRWPRSLADATRAVDAGLRVRVVKGQWEATSDPDADAREGFFEVVDRLAGRARHVAVATHDVPLAERCLRRLHDARTPAELELLFGLPMRAARRRARTLGVPVRIYVPYGASWLPYSLAYARRHPRVLGWMLADLLGF